jgi:Na+-transporting NADH:ubiquinone oxidoreductase subunit B
MSVHVHGKWNSHVIMLATVVALLPPLAAVLHERGLALLLGLALAAAVTLLWQLTFERVRRRPHTWSWVATAIVFTVLMPPGVPLWQQALAVSFGVVLGEQVFGGWGKNFLHPAVVAVAFLLFSFPVPTTGSGSIGFAMVSAASGAMLLAAGLVSWRIMAGFAIAATATTFALAGSMNGSWIPGGYIVFLVCDPVSAASTNAGRWAHGIMAGGLMIMLGHTGSVPGSVSVNATVFAALLASLFAPLVDRMVIEAHVWRRSRHNA